MSEHTRLTAIRPRAVWSAANAAKEGLTSRVAPPNEGAHFKKNEMHMGSPQNVAAKKKLSGERGVELLYGQADDFRTARPERQRANIVSE